MCVCVGRYSGFLFPGVSRQCSQICVNELNFGGYMAFLDVTGSPSELAEKTGQMGGRWWWERKLEPWDMAPWHAAFGRCLLETGSGLEVEETEGWDAYRQLHWDGHKGMEFWTREMELEWRAGTPVIHWRNGHWTGKGWSREGGVRTTSRSGNPEEQEHCLFQAEAFLQGRPVMQSP